MREFKFFTSIKGEKKPSDLVYSHDLFLCKKKKKKIDVAIRKMHFCQIQTSFKTDGFNFRVKSKLCGSQSCLCMVKPHFLRVSQPSERLFIMLQALQT